MKLKVGDDYNVTVTPKETAEEVAHRRLKEQIRSAAGFVILVGFGVISVICFLLEWKQQ